jgi:hypothetical protein
VEFARLVREGQARMKEERPGMERKLALEKAIADAVTYCKRHGVLRDFFENLSPEEANMLAKEWDFDEELRVRKEEGREEGWENGRALFSRLIDQAKSIDDLKKMFEASFSEPPGQSVKS